MIYNNYNGDNFDFSAWGGETTPTPVEEPVEESAAYGAVSRGF